MNHHSEAGSGTDWRAEADRAAFAPHRTLPGPDERAQTGVELGGASGTLWIPNELIPEDPAAAEVLLADIRRAMSGPAGLVDIAATPGTPWDVLAIARYKNGRRLGDGDTLDLLRTRIAQLGDDWFRVTDLAPKPIRLVWVDTPEKKDHDPWARATADTTGWIERKMALGGFTVVTYGSAGWDRELGDLIAADGESCSQWLLTEGNGGVGWPYYAKGA